jgi:hypothetical protein
MLGKIHGDLTIEDRGLLIALGPRLPESRRHYRVYRCQRDTPGYAETIELCSFMRKHGYLQVSPSLWLAPRSDASGRR